jgi:hypothetical protein
MDGYELHGHLSEQLFSAIVDCFANFSSSVGSVSEEIYSLQAVYFSYTYASTLSAPPRRQADAVLKDDDALCDMLNDLLRLGVCVLEQAPSEPGFLNELAARIQKQLKTVGD